MQMQQRWRNKALLDVKKKLTMSNHYKKNKINLDTVAVNIENNS